MRMTLKSLIPTIAFTVLCAPSWGQGGWIDIPASSLPLTLSTNYGDVQIDWTPDGVPEVDGTSNAAAFFGWGYAQSVDRFFQMEIARRVMRGTTAELLGAGDGSDSSPPSMDSKAIRMRNVHFATLSLAKLEADHQVHFRMLKAYSAGVNRYLEDRLGPHATWGDDPDLFRQRLTNIDDLFLTNQLESKRLDLWTPLDTLLAQWRISEVPDLDYASVLNNSLRYDNALNAQATNHEEALEAALGVTVLDEDSMTVQQSDLTKAEVTAIEDYGLAHNWPNQAAATYRHYVDPSAPQPKFSHAFAVTGERTTTGRGVLLGMPQVVASKMFHEISVKSPSFTTRGIGFAGVPGYMVGFNSDVAWSVTGAGTSTKMLLRLEAPTQTTYDFNGATHPIVITTPPMDVRKPYIAGMEPEWTTENVEVKWAPEIKRAANGEQTVLDGVPILNQSDFQTGDEVADIPSKSHIGLLHYRYFDNGRETLIAYMDMLVATSVDDLDVDLQEYSTPAVTIVATDHAGDARFWFAKPVLLHSSDTVIAPLGMLGLQECALPADLPSDLVPMEFLPKVKNPANRTVTDIQNGVDSDINGIILLGNSGAVGGWYPIPTYSGLGESIRSWRLRQMLSKEGPHGHWTPEELLAMNYDDVNPKFLAIVELARYVSTHQSVTPPVFTGGAQTFLERFDNSAFDNGVGRDWVEAGGHLHAAEKLMAPLSYLNREFRAGNLFQDLAAQYGEGDAGTAFLFKDLLHKKSLGENPFITPSNQAVGDQALNYLQKALQNAEARLFGRVTPGVPDITYEPYSTNPLKWPLEFQARHYNFKDNGNLKTSGAQFTVKFHEEFHPYADLFPGNDIESDVLHNPKYGIGAQVFNAYSQWVHFGWHDPTLPIGEQNAYAISNPGNSLHPTSPFWSNNYAMWRRDGKFFDLTATQAAPRQYLLPAPLQ